MEPRFIIRIEHSSDGKGLFTSLAVPMGSNIMKQLGKLYSRHFDFPTPMSEQLNLFQDDLEWFCAFHSVEQLQKWVFKSEMKYLHAIGFEVYLHKVTDYQIGDFQVIYTKQSISSSEIITQLFI